MTAETQRHAGHADIVRELIDGQIGRRASDGNIDDAYDWPAYVAKVDGSRAGAVYRDVTRLETRAHRQETRTCSSI